jgi:hypothetical protein
MRSDAPHLADLVAYVRQAGWRHVDDDRAEVWVPPDEAHNDLLIALPKRATVSDIGAQIEEALRVVAFVEGRTVSEAANSIVNGGADTLSLRLVPDLPSGTAPLATLQDAVAGLRSLVVGAAASLTNSDLVLPSRRPALVESYAARAHVSSRPGSFILDVALPLAVEVDDGEKLEQDVLVELAPQPYGRRVTDRIRNVAANALTKAQEIVEGSASIDEFARPDLRLGNAMELEALARMAGDLDAPYQLRLSQSALATRTAPTTLLTASPAQREQLVQAADFLRRTQPQSDLTVEGYVIKLSRKGSFGPGDVTLHAYLDDSGKLKSCVMNVAEEDYDAAMRAHRHGLVVVAKGNLVTSGNYKRLKSVSVFHVVESV